VSELRDVYDDATMAAIDYRSGEPHARPSGGLQGRLAGGALVVGLLHGVKDALEDEDVDPVVEIEEERRAARMEPVTVTLVPGYPKLGVATVRRWLL